MAIVILLCNEQLSTKKTVTMTNMVCARTVAWTEALKDDLQRSIKQLACLAELQNSSRR